MKFFGIACAFISASSYGIGTVLQAKSVGNIQKDLLAKNQQFAVGESQSTLNLMISMLQPLFIIGTLCDFFGFVTNAISDRLAPLFLVQSILSTNILFATVFGIFILHNRLSKRAVGAIVVIIIGLLVLGFTSADEGHLPGPPHFSWWIFATSLVVLALGFISFRLFPQYQYLLGGIVAGLLFGIVAISVRLCQLSIKDLGLGTIIIAGIGAFYFFSAAVSQQSVTVTLASISLGETIIPALVGLKFLGDTTIPGFAWLVWVGLGVSIAGIMLLLNSPGAVFA